MAIDVRIAHINVHQPASDTVRKFNINGVVEFVRDGGVGTLNELGKAADHRYVASLQGIGSYVYGENGILWDESRFEKVWQGKFRIMVGGHVGADGGPGGDSRRVGPSRWLLVVVLKEKASGITFIVSVTHLVAKADTSAKWRRGIRAASIRLAGLRLSRITKKYQSGLLNGDMNYIGPRIDWNYLAEVQLPTIRTHGNLRYDRAFVWGEVKMIGQMKSFKRRSDHLGFTYVVRIGDGPSPGVPPVSNTGGGVVHPRPKRNNPPVAHPWARRTRRWKRRHPILWRRIKRWRRRHPRH